MIAKRKKAKASVAGARAQQGKNGVVGSKLVISLSQDSELRQLESQALSGDANIAYYLANLYYTNPFAQDTVKGWKFLLLAAGLGNMYAEADMGTIYYRKAKTAADKKAVFDWFKAAAKHGHAEAMMVLSHFYQRGYGCRCDLGKAQIWEENAKFNNYDIDSFLHILGLN